MSYDIKKIPKLPYGEGTITIHNDELLVYKKVIKFSDGTKIRKSIYAKTPKECMQKMRELETQLQQEHETPRSKELLCDAIDKWLENVKKPILKPQSYRRLQSTINNQIKKSKIGHLRYQTIISEEIQNIINDLNENNLSRSTIKKTYDCLNDFFRYVSMRDKIDNPMLLVVMPTISNIKAETKTIEFFEQDDIDKFIEECGARYKTGNLKYKYGYAIAANIYLGMRAGELLALQWKDIDWERNTIYVCKTLIEENNPAYDENNPQLMKEKGISKIRFTVQSSTKRSRNRYVPINSKAKNLLQLHKNNCQFAESNDYIISTSNRRTTTIKNLSDTIKAIEIAAETNTQASGTHILRHTCASLYFRKGVPIETICQILGNTREVCEKTYLHFVEEQLKEAASKIDIIEI